MKRFLVTTALEETWRDNEPVLFLGEWCRLYSRKDRWSKMDAEVVPYHWDDREKLYRDYLCLQGLYEELLKELAERLNTLHGVKHSLRYWRILVGPWLGYFVQMLFDRWEMIGRAVSSYTITGAQVLDTPPEQMVPNDMDHFGKLFITDSWNEAIYGQLLRDFTSVPIVRQQLATLESAEAEPILPFARRLKRKLALAASRVSQVFSRDDESFFLSTYLPIKQDFLLQWRLGQVPKIWRPFPTPKAEVDWTKRQWQMRQSGTEDFPAIVRAMIPRHIPSLYLEGYDTLQERYAALPWPKNPPLIFTSNSYSSDDVFKAWAAEKVENGVPLIVGQHGGSYGTALWNFIEEHEVGVSDAWLSWGWNDEGNSKIKPVGNLKIVGRRLNWDPEGYALIIEMGMPRYSYFMYSVPVSSQWLGYFEDQSSFVASLPQCLREKLLVRLYGHDYGWCQKERWHDRFPQVRLEDGVVPITSLIEKTRLYISTYNATTYLESFAMNVPTVIYWNPKHWELRASAIPYFEDLKRVGIFHENPESAARHVTAIWDDVDAWWNSPAVQEVLERFKARYSHQPNNLLDRVEAALCDVMSDAKNSQAKVEATILEHAKEA